MSSFTDPLIVEVFNDFKGSGWLFPPRIYRIARELRYHVGTFPSKEVIRIPEGYEFDGATVPLGFRWLIPPMHPHYAKATALHDYLYTELENEYPKDRADEIFYEALGVLNCPIWKKELMYFAVRNFGKRI